jgi:hypothetical protein
VVHDLAGSGRERHGEQPTCRAGRGGCLGRAWNFAPSVSVSRAGRERDHRDGRRPLLDPADTPSCRASRGPARACGRTGHWRRCPAGPELLIADCDPTGLLWRPFAGSRHAENQVSGQNDPGAHERPLAPRVGPGAARRHRQPGSCSSAPSGRRVAAPHGGRRDAALLAIPETCRPARHALAFKPRWAPALHPLRHGTVQPSGEWKNHRWPSGSRAPYSRTP